MSIRQGECVPKAGNTTRDSPHFPHLESHMETKLHRCNICAKDLDQSHAGSRVAINMVLARIYWKKISQGPISRKETQEIKGVAKKGSVFSSTDCLYICYLIPMLSATNIWTFKTHYVVSAGHTTSIKTHRNNIYVYLCGYIIYMCILYICMYT